MTSDNGHEPQGLDPMQMEMAIRQGGAVVRLRIDHGGNVSTVVTAKVNQLLQHYHADELERATSPVAGGKS